MAKSGRKPIDDKDRRKHPVTCRLTDDEIVKIDGRRGGMTRGEWIRTAALKKPPRIIPEINKEAWSDLARLTGNFNQIVKRINQGLSSEISRSEIIEIRDQVQALRQGFIGGNLEG